jgi:hypothetical protein
VLGERSIRSPVFICFIKKIGINYIDAALAIPIRNNLLDPRYLSGFGTGKIIVPGHLQSYKVGDIFKKVGRTTGLVTGIVDSIHVDVKVEYGDDLGNIVFHDQTMVKGMGSPVSLLGDSGSVWLKKNDNFAAAVNFVATDQGYSVSFPIHWAMRIFHTSIARPTSPTTTLVRGGFVKGKPPKNDFSYVWPLTKKQFNQIRVVRLYG